MFQEGIHGHLVEVFAGQSKQIPYIAFIVGREQWRQLATHRVAAGIGHQVLQSTNVKAMPIWAPS